MYVQLLVTSGEPDLVRALGSRKTFVRRAAQKLVNFWLAATNSPPRWKLEESSLQRSCGNTPRKDLRCPKLGEELAGSEKLGLASAELLGFCHKLCVRVLQLVFYNANPSAEPSCRAQSQRFRRILWGGGELRPVL